MTITTFVAWAALGLVIGHIIKDFRARASHGAVRESCPIRVEINGKLRGRVTLDSKANEQEVLAAALANNDIYRLLEGNVLKKVIYVPGRRINIVVC